MLCSVLRQQPICTAFLLLGVYKQLFWLLSPQITTTNDSYVLTSSSGIMLVLWPTLQWYYG